jgi:XTP/dITP diphosphohydrolase
MTERRFQESRLLLATHNAGKLAESRAILAPLGIALISAAERGLAEPAETETSFAGNARLKGHAAARATGMVALADDSGIELDALDGAPGVHTADWAEVPGGRDFARAMRRTRDALAERDAAPPWRARFVCVLALVWPDGHDATVSGTVEGQFVWPPRGADGHGYDPVFQPDGHAVTFAEMTAAAKNRISHRARAFAALLAGPLGR